MANQPNSPKMKTFSAAKKRNDFGFLNIESENKIYPPFFNIDAIELLKENWETDSNDIFICTHQKVGTHLTKQFVSEILRAVYPYPENNPMSTGDIGHATIPWPEVMVSQYGYAHFQEFIAKTNHFPRVWYIHCENDDLPMKKIHPNSKFIYVFRDPKGAAVSQFHFYKSHPLLEVEKTLEMDQFISLFLEGNLYFGDYHEHVKNWILNTDLRINRDNFLVLSYEDLVENKILMTKKLASFLCSKILPSSKIREIIEATAFQNMKNKISENPGSFHFNVNTFFRSGKTDDWKKHLSVKNETDIDNKTAIRWNGIIKEKVYSTDDFKKTSIN
jgi:hypothetical protein